MTQWIREGMALASIGLFASWMGCCIVWFIYRDCIDLSPIPYPKFLKRKK
jgi:hypothetical protein